MASVRPARRPASWLAPAAPPEPPLVEAKVMLRRSWPETTLASSNIAAVPDSSARAPRPAASRWATTTRPPPGAPAWRATTVVRRRSPSIVSPSARELLTEKPSEIERNVAAISRASASSCTSPGRRCG
jgi:hypothetical protein